MNSTTLPKPSGSRRVFRRLCSITAAAFVGHGFAAEAALPPAEELLPEDTLAVITVPDATAFRASALRSPDAQLWNDPSMKPFRDKFMAKLDKELLATLEKDLAMPLDEFVSMPRGQFSLALSADGWAGTGDGGPAALLLMDAGEKSESLKAGLAAAIQRHADAGQPVRTENIGGLDFTVLSWASEPSASDGQSEDGEGEETSDNNALDQQTADLISYYTIPVNLEGVTGEQEKSEEAAEPEAANEVYVAQHDSLLIAGTSKSAVGVVAAHLHGGGQPSLADDPDFKKDKASGFANDPLYYGWLNVSRSLSLLNAADAEDGKEEAEELLGIDPDAILKATGLSGLRSASFAAFEKPEGSSFSFHLNAPEATRAGLLKMLALPAKDAGIPAFVPADASGFTRIRLDGKKVWNDLRDIASGVSPDAVGGLDLMLDMVDMQAGATIPGFNIRSAILENLGDDLIAYGKPSEQTILIAVRDPEKFISGIKALASLAGAKEAEQPRGFLGHQIHGIDMTEIAGEEGGEGKKPAVIYLSEANGYLAIGDNAGLIESYLRNVGVSPANLADAPGIAAAAREVGGTGGGFFSYHNDAEILRSTFGMLSDPTTAALVPEEVTEWVDFSLLPDAGRVTKYFGISVTGCRADADGITLQSFTAKP